MTDERTTMKQHAPHLVAAIEKIVGTSRRPLVGIGARLENGPLQYIVYLRRAHNTDELPSTFQGFAVAYEVAGEIHALKASA